MLGRFIQPDTIIPSAGNPQTWNRYSYVANRPINFNDPSGHWFETALDIAFIIYDIHDISKNGLNWENGLALTADIASAVLPVVTGGGLAVRAIAHADDAVDVVKTANKAVNTALASDKLKALGNIIGDICSFSADTKVATQDGEKSISAVEVGDYVLAWNEADGTVGFYEVTDIFSHEDEVLTELIIDGEWIETTPEHPFYTEEEGWLPAGELKPGMHIRQADGDYELVWMKWNVHKSQEMYNFTVDTAHTYFVGDGQWLVHNSCPPYKESAFGTFSAKVKKYVLQRDNYICFNNCGRTATTVDHIVSRKQIWEEGAWEWTKQQRNQWLNDVNNLTAACTSCNPSKGSKKLLLWMLEKLK